MILPTLYMADSQRIEVGFNGLTFACCNGTIGMPTALAQHYTPQTQCVAGLPELVRTITVERDLIAGKLLFLTIDFTLHETQLAVVIKAHTDMFRCFTVDIEFNQPKLIALPAVFT
jgi:hypothetical protein